MQKIFLIIFHIFLISSLGFAELKLKLPVEITGETTRSIIHKNIENNLKLSIPAEAVSPADMKELVKGMILLGILADVSIPMGSDDGFKHIAGTGFSGHAVGSYFLSTSFFLSLRAGYIKFGTQTEEGSNQSGSYKYEDDYSQIPILLGAYYMFATSGSFKPYVGLALGMFIQKYSYTWSFSYDIGGGQTYSDSQTGDASSTGFGVVPAAGFYMLLGSIILQAAVEYSYIFSDLPAAEEDEYTPPLSKMSRIVQEENGETTSEKASYISINVGVSFPIGQ